jgi:hypothetical protein
METKTQAPELGYRKLSLSIIDNFGIFLIIELSIIWAKIIDN